MNDQANQPTPTDQPAREPAESPAHQRPVLVIPRSPDGGGQGPPLEEKEPDEGPQPMSKLTSDPAELVRIGTMLSRLNSELRQIDLDEPGTHRLQSLHHQVLDALADNLNDDLVRELHNLVPGLGDDERSEPEVRLAHLQLVGWMEGLFQGIQLAAVGQQLSERGAATTGPPPAQPPRTGIYL